jgi:hypothetical protein
VLDSAPTFFTRRFTVVLVLPEEMQVTEMEG